MKKIIIAVVCIVLLAAVFLYACAPSHRGETVYSTITINEGDSVFKIASDLEKAGIISNSPAFIAKVFFSGYRSKIKYGTFSLSSDLSYDEILQVISGNGIRTDVATLTIPEGYSLQQIAQLIEKSEIKVTADEFYQALNDDYNFAFIDEIPPSPYRDYMLQGFLFPSTYEFYIDTTAHDIVASLLGEFEKQYANAGDNTTDLSFYQVITVASIIEREALLKNELPVIAGVIRNRLKADMPLQIDATVVYAVTDGKYDKTSVSYADLEVDSRYNTYKYKGLPPGPICNPGAEAIKAALNPQLNEYYFYHTDETKNDGSHIFTSTYEEHSSTMN